MRIAELLAEAAGKLRVRGIADASLEAERIMQHVLDCSRAQLYLASDKSLPSSQEEVFFNLIILRSRRIPLQHLTGHCEFWSLDFAVGPEVLIPRPETEFLLECVLKSVNRKSITLALDLCTGSGVIATVLARELNAAILATDLSLPALHVAQRNLARHTCLDRVDLLCCDLFSSIIPTHQFDLIVSNPPYVALHEKNELEPEVKDHDPHLALFSGEEGMDCIRSILRHAPKYLRSQGSLFLEIGALQGDAVLSAAAQVGCYRNASVTRDWSGRDRVFHGRC